MLEVAFGAVFGAIKGLFKLGQETVKIIKYKSDLKIETAYDGDNCYLKVSNYDYKDIYNLKIIEKRNLESLKFNKDNYDFFYKLKEKYKNENVSYMVNSIVMKLRPLENFTKNYKLENTQLLSLYCDFYTESLSITIDKLKNDLDDLIHYHRVVQSIYLMKLYGINNKNKRNVKSELLKQFNMIRDMLNMFLDVYEHLQMNSLNLGLTIDNKLFLQDDKLFNSLIFHIITLSCDEDDDVPIDLCMKLLTQVNKIAENCIVVPVRFINIEENKLKGNKTFKVNLDNRILIKLYKSKFFEQKNVNFLQLNPYKLKFNKRDFILEHNEISYLKYVYKKKNKQYLANSGEFNKVSWNTINVKQKISFSQKIVEIKKEHNVHYE